VNCDLWENLCVWASFQDSSFPNASFLTWKKKLSCEKFLVPLEEYLALISRRLRPSVTDFWPSAVPGWTQPHRDDPHVFGFNSRKEKQILWIVTFEKISVFEQKLSPPSRTVRMIWRFLIAYTKAKKTANCFSLIQRQKLNPAKRIKRWK